MPERSMIDVDGTDAVSKVLLDLLNRFPGLAEGERILFATVPERGGLAFFPVSGAVFQQNQKDITGHVKQSCQYPFTILYSAAPKTEKQRLRIKTFLDTLGRWLEGQPVFIGGEFERIDAYPALQSGNRKISAISRLNSAHLNTSYQNGMEDWVISAALTYQNEYDEP